MSTSPSASSTPRKSLETAIGDMLKMRGEIAYLPVWGTNGVYPENDWHAAAHKVEQIGRQYGFDAVATT